MMIKPEMKRCSDAATTKPTCGFEPSSSYYSRARQPLAFDHCPAQRSRSCLALSLRNRRRRSRPPLSFTSGAPLVKEGHISVWTSVWMDQETPAVWAGKSPRRTYTLDFIFFLFDNKPVVAYVLLFSMFVFIFPARCQTLT